MSARVSALIWIGGEYDQLMRAMQTEELTRLLVRLVRDVHLDVASLACDPGLAVQACTQRDFAVTAHEKGLGRLGKERLDSGSEDERRIEVRKDVKMAIEVSNRAIAAVLRLELDGPTDKWW